MIKEGEILAEGTMNALVDEIKKYINSHGGEPNHIINLYTERPSSANIRKGDGNLYQFKATSNMYIGKPNHDGHMLHFSWDNNDGFDSQLFIPNGNVANNGYHPAIRGMSLGSWGDWKYLAFVSDLDNYVKKADEVVWHCLEASAAGSYPNIIVGDGKKHIIVGPGLGSDSYSNLTISVRGILAGHKHGDDASFYYIPSNRQSVQFGSSDGSTRHNFTFTQEQKNNLYKIPATYRITETYSGIYVGAEVELIEENYLTKW